MGGLLVAVVATALPERRGFHPRGVSDRTGFAAMGIVEAMAHGYDILSAHGVDYSPDGEVCRSVLDRLFRSAARSEDPWHDLLAATGRTPRPAASHGPGTPPSESQHPHLSYKFSTCMISRLRPSLP